MTRSTFTLSRRRLLAGAAGAALTTPMINRAWAADPVQINMLAWYGHAEPDIVAEFEAANNVKFVPKYYAGGDNMLGLIAQSPPGTYDLILSDAEFVQQLNMAGYIEEMDPSLYPFDDFWPEYQNFPGHWTDDQLWSVMVRFGLLGVSYNSDVMTREEAMSYNAFWNPKITGKLGHFDWHLPSLGQISLLMGNRDPSPFDISEDAWEAVMDKTLSLKPQVGGYFDYGGTFASLKNGEMLAMAGIGDWITGVLQKDGAPVASVIPEEGGIQWTESYSIGKGTTKHEIINKFINYMLSPEGQVKSIKMAAYPGLSPLKSGWKAIQEADPAEAKRSGLIEGDDQSPIKLLSEGRLFFRDIPRQQDLEDWNDFWSEYKTA
ncbi:MULTISPECIES: polyamine ABC transporter substrate-binding protein [Mameliella]|jgi:spermidine/putrescine transport system substrate-binding protein|uniref:polyamine ABC transporter substrate-binding protein n=1 Tax=Mameliella TaxID=1434019 RepID=UPI000B52B099|nr:MULTISPECIES: spermidine/putrescine ABC transporter substrate-binding protein [Mameliella]MCR9274594.1 spermidine/putrescine ABC transporter substrate-binding protein [Paracoccaceae bacterium]OWV60139.1 ABC transporter substrate-binding protein [Mameliella alba]